MTWIEARLIVPTEQEQGSRVRPEAYQVGLVKLERFLVSAFGGYTLTEGEGAWRPTGGPIVRERVRVYLFAYDGADRDLAEIVRRLPADIRETFDQEAVYLSRTRLEGQPVHLARGGGQ